MLNKGDLFIVTSYGEYWHGGNGFGSYGGKWKPNPMYEGVVFEATGFQDSLVYAKVAGTTTNRGGAYKAGEKHTLNQSNGAIFVKANRDTLEAAGLTEAKKPEYTFDYDELRKQSTAALLKQKDKSYWKFIDEYIQWVKVQAVENKDTMTVLAATIEIEAKLLGDNSAVAKSATQLLNIMESIEVVNKFYDGIKK